MPRSNYQLWILLYLSSLPFKALALTENPENVVFEVETRSSDRIFPVQRVCANAVNTAELACEKMSGMQWSITTFLAMILAPHVSIATASTLAYLQKSAMN